MTDKTKHNTNPQLGKGQRVKISATPGCMTHSGQPVGFAPHGFAGQIGEVVSEQEYGDYKVRIADGSEAWIAAAHLDATAAMAVLDEAPAAT
jgi:ribosomal protein L21E